MRPKWYLPECVSSVEESDSSWPDGDSGCRVTGKESGKTVPTTCRPAKSTIQGVVHQFSQLHHRKSTMERILSSIGNVFRRICHHDGRAVRLLDDCQSTDSELAMPKPDQSRRATARTNRMNRVKHNANKACADVEDSPIFMMVTFPGSHSKKEKKSMKRDMNQRRSRWTSSTRKQRLNISGNNRRSVHKARRVNTQNDTRANDLQARATLPPRRGKPKRCRVNQNEEDFSDLFSETIPKNFRKDKTANIVPRSSRHYKGFCPALSESVDTFATDGFESDVSSSSCQDVEQETVMHSVETAWDPHVRSSSCRIMSSPNKSLYRSERDYYITKRFHVQEFRPLRMCFSAIVRSTNDCTNLRGKQTEPGQQLSKSDSILTGGSDGVDITYPNLMACEHLAASLEDLVSDYPSPTPTNRRPADVLCSVPDLLILS